MGHRMTSFTADAMHGLVSDMAAGFQARTDLVERNRDSVRAMLKQFAKERLDAETRRIRARQRFAKSLRSGVKSLMGDFRNLHAEMASEIKAASSVWSNRSTKEGIAAASPTAQEPKVRQTSPKRDKKDLS